eukprot:gene26971-biopygen17312
MARHNPLMKLADGASPWVMAVTGADAYVSADWYTSVDQVPTWLYQAVHLTGTVRLLSDRELGQHLDALSARFESWLAPKTPNSFKEPWTSSKMTAGRLEAMKKAIVGLVMSVEEVEGSFKLNQHKSDADHLSVATALARQPDAGAQVLANEMRALRPHLFADDLSQMNVMATRPDVTTDRTVTIAGTDRLRARFNANAWSGRAEGGYRFVAPALGGVGFTPYAAGQFTTFDLPAYAETVVSGTNAFALAYGARSVTASHQHSRLPRQHLVQP